MGKLALLLAEAYPQEQSVLLAADRLRIPAGRLTGVNANEKWQSLIKLVDDSTSHSLDMLLDDAISMLPRGHASNSIIAWRERAAPTASFIESVGEARRWLSEVTAHVDPRRSVQQLHALTSVLRDIVDRLGRPEQLDPDLRADALQLQTSARRAMRTARRLSLSIAFADEQLGGLSAATTPATRFEAQSSIVGQLVDAADTLEQEIHQFFVLLGFDPLGP